MGLSLCKQDGEGNGRKGLYAGVGLAPISMRYSIHMSCDDDPFEIEVPGPQATVADAQKAIEQCRGFTPSSQLLFVGGGGGGGEGDGETPLWTDEVLTNVVGESNALQLIVRGYASRGEPELHWARWGDGAAIGGPGGLTAVMRQDTPDFRLITCSAVVGKGAAGAAGRTRSSAPERQYFEVLLSACDTDGDLWVKVGAVRPGADHGKPFRVGPDPCVGHGRCSFVYNPAASTATAPAAPLKLGDRVGVLICTAPAGSNWRSGADGSNGKGYIEFFVNGEGPVPGAGFRGVSGALVLGVQMGYRHTAVTLLPDAALPTQTQTQTQTQSAAPPPSSPAASGSTDGD